MVTIGRIVVASFLLFLAHESARGSTLCSTALSVLAGGASCSDVDFSLAFSATTGANRGVTDSSILVTVTSTGPSNLTVTYGPNVPLSGTGTLVTYDFQYTVSYASSELMTAEAISVFDPQISGSGIVGAFVGVDGDFADLTPFSNAADDGDTLSASSSLPGLGSPQAVEDNITLTQVEGTATAGNVVNTLTFTSVPEPGTIFLCGAGLLGARLLRRFKK